MISKRSKFYTLMLCLLLVAACGRQSPNNTASDAEIEYDRGTVASEGYTVTFEYIGTAQ